MNRPFLGLFAAVVLAAPLSCLDEEGPPEFTTEGLCRSDETEVCDCPGGELGLRLCNARGVLGPCLCPGCTAFPDCEACTGCFDSCMCLSGNAFEAGCRKTCDNLPDSGGGAGACRPETCPSPPSGRDETACCTDDLACGFTVGGSDVCAAAHAPGTDDPSCPASDSLGFSASGCCTDDGNCGVRDDELFGCLETSLLTGGDPTSCDPIR